MSFQISQHDLMCSTPARRQRAFDISQNRCSQPFADPDASYTSLSSLAESLGEVLERVERDAPDSEPSLDLASLAIAESDEYNVRSTPAVLADKRRKRFGRLVEVEYEHSLEALSIATLTVYGDPRADAASDLSAPPTPRTLPSLDLQSDARSSAGSGASTPELCTSNSFPSTAITSSNSLASLPSSTSPITDACRAAPPPGSNAYEDVLLSQSSIHPFPISQPPMVWDWTDHTLDEVCAMGAFWRQPAVSPLEALADRSPQHVDDKQLVEDNQATAGTMFIEEEQDSEHEGSEDFSWAVEPETEAEANVSGDARLRALRALLDKDPLLTTASRRRASIMDPSVSSANGRDIAQGARPQRRNAHSAPACMIASCSAPGALQSVLPASVEDVSVRKDRRGTFGSPHVEEHCSSAYASALRDSADDADADAESEIDFESEALDRLELSIEMLRLHDPFATLSSAPAVLSASSESLLSAKPLPCVPFLSTSSSSHEPRSAAPTLQWKPYHPPTLAAATSTPSVHPILAAALSTPSQSGPPSQVASFSVMSSGYAAEQSFSFIDDEPVQDDNTRTGRKGKGERGAVRQKLKKAIRQAGMVGWWTKAAKEKA